MVMVMGSEMLSCVTSGIKNGGNHLRLMFGTPKDSWRLAELYLTNVEKIQDTCRLVEGYLLNVIQSLKMAGISIEVHLLSSIHHPPQTQTNPDADDRDDDDTATIYYSSLDHAVVKE